MARRRLSIRQSLIRTLVGLILLTSGAILAVTTVGGVRAVRELSTEIVDSKAAAIADELERFFGALRDNVLIGRGWAERGLLDPVDADALNALFVPVLERYPQISSMMVANGRGEEYLLLRDPVDRARWSNRVVRADEWGTRVWNREWGPARGSAREWWSELDYDPRRRKWYRDALAAPPEDPVAWTEPSIFFITKDPGLTAGAAWSDPERPDEPIVVAFDLLLLDVSRLTTGLDVSENGLAFVAFETSAGGRTRIVGLPRDPRFVGEPAIRDALRSLQGDDAVADAVPELPGPADLELPLVDAAIERWKTRGRSSRPIRFDVDGETWWSGTRTVRVGGNELRVYTLAPASDFLGNVIAQSQRIAVVSLLALVVSVAVAIRLARGYGSPLETLALKSRRIRELDLTPSDPVESPLAEVQLLAREQERMRNTLDSFARYVPVDLVRGLLERGEAAQLGTSPRELTILFTDIEGYSRVAEELTPKELSWQMAEYFEALLEIFAAHAGSVNELLGDGVLAYWGAPVPDEDHAAHAVEAVLHARARLLELDARWSAEGRPALPTRFGLASGRARVGNIGAPSRISYSAVGDVANLASRLEGINRFYGTYVMAAGSVREAAGPGFEWRHLDTARPKGKDYAVELHEPLGKVGEVADTLLALRDGYERALALYRERRFDESAALLRELADEHPDDAPTRRLLALCVALAADPPPPDWNAMTTFDRK